MGTTGSRTHLSRRYKLFVLSSLVALLATACDSGLITAIAGTGSAGNSGDGGPAISATFEQPGGIVVIPGGGYYVVDQAACVIRRVASNGTIATIAGTGTCGYSGDGGPATSAQIQPDYTNGGQSMFPAPSGQLALDATGNLYLADSGNLRVRKITPSGTITSVAGNGSGNYLSPCSGASVLPGSLAVGPDGTVYLSCPLGIGSIQPNGSVQSVYSGSAPNSMAVISMTVDASGNLYFADEMGVVHERTPAGIVTTYADVSQTNTPSGQVAVTGLTVGPDGTIFAALGPSMLPVSYGFEGVPIFDSFNGNKVLRLGPGTSTLIAGNGNPDPGTSAQHGHGTDLDLTPYGIAATADGYLLVSSGHVVYSIREAAQAEPWSGTACNPANMHPGTDLSDLDLSGADLHGCDFSGVNVTGTNFTGANFHNAHGTGIIGTPAALPDRWLLISGTLVGLDSNLSGMDLSGLNLSGLDLHGKDLSSTNLSNTNLSNANLSDSNLTGATLTTTNFAGADLSGANLTSPRSASPDFTNADLSGALIALGGLDASQPSYYYSPIFTGANLTGADFRGINFSTGSVTSGGITGTPQLPVGMAVANGYLIAAYANLAGADLSGLSLSGLTFNHANLTGANLSSSTLDNSTFDAATVAGANFSNASATPLRATALHGVPTSAPSGYTFRTSSTQLNGVFVRPGVDMSLADLSGIDFGGLDLTGANLSGTTLVNVDFTNTNLTNANISGTVYQYSTGTVSIEGSTWVGTIVQGADLSGLSVQVQGWQQACVTPRVHSNAIAGTPAKMPSGPVRLARGKLVGADTDLTGIDFRTWGSDLNGVSFNCAGLANTNFSGVNIAFRNFIGADLSNADLSGANLSGASIDGTNLAGTNFTGTTLTYLYSGIVTGSPVGLPSGWQVLDGVLTGPTARFSNLSSPTDLANRDLSGANLAGAMFTFDDSTGANFTGANLAGATFKNVNLTGAIFDNADLSGAQVTNTDFTGADFTGTNLSGAAIELTTIGGSIFAGATLTGLRSRLLTGTPASLPAQWATMSGFLVGPTVDMSNRDLTLVNFTNANFTNANFTNAVLNSVTLNHATITGADFTGADFTRLRAGAVVGAPAVLPTGWAVRGGFLVGPGGAPTYFNMTGVDLSGLNLTGTSFTYSNLSGANLAGTNLTGTTLTKTTFTGATGTPTGGSTATYSATTCPDATTATSPATCVGHGFGA